MSAQSENNVGVGGEIWGEGLPYAPEGWPNPGDKWGWKVIGSGKSSTGYWKDRVLVLPPSLIEKHNPESYQITSKSDLGRYLEAKYPEVDVKQILSSFQWEIPCSPEKGNGETSFKITPDANPESNCHLHCLPSHIRALVIENDVYQALLMIESAQRTVYKSIQEKLFAQKDLLLSMFEKHDSNRPSNSTIIPEERKALQKEVDKLLQMMEIAVRFIGSSQDFQAQYFPTD